MRTKIILYCFQKIKYVWQMFSKMKKNDERKDCEIERK